MPAIVIIPARYASTRFPGKPLCLLKGKFMIQHVYERAKKAKFANEVYVATDSEAIIKAVESFGGKVVMTSNRHPSGTDRIAEAVKKIKNISADDIIVNVQGDEPLIEPKMIDDVIALMDDKDASIGTLAKKIENIEEVLNPNVVKVVFNEEGYALYFSRAPIPYHRDIFQKTEDKEQKTDFKEKNFTLYKGLPPESLSSVFFFKHIGIYAYKQDALIRFSKAKTTRLENIEKLEQLRALEMGLKIKVGQTELETIGVDTPQDLERVEECLSLSS
jgi:3-deoxy-manno-octulosonate cytidylyltransferase (CMP-KDO synthetase)